MTGWLFHIPQNKKNYRSYEFKMDLRRQPLINVREKSLSLPEDGYPFCNIAVPGDFLRIPFKFMYYTVCAPFHLAKVKNSGTEILKVTAWRPQKIFCAVLTLLDCMWAINNFRRCLPQSTHNPAAYIKMFTIVLFQLSKILLIHKVWSTEGRASLEYLANQRTSLNSTFQVGWFRGKLGVFSICLVYTSVALVTLTWAPQSRQLKDASYTTRWWTSIVSKGREIFFMEKIHVNKILSDDILSWNTLVGILTFLGLYHR